MARTAGGPHPKTARVFYLSDLGYSQRQVASETGLSQSTIQRILSGPSPVSHNTPNAPVDADDVFQQYDELYASAMADGSLEALKEVHTAAVACHKNGYDVPFRSLPYLMALAAAEQEASTAGERNSLRAETMMVYQDMREWRECNA